MYLIFGEKVRGLGLVELLKGVFLDRDKVLEKNLSVGKSLKRPS